MRSVSRETDTGTRLLRKFQQLNGYRRTHAKQRLQSKRQRVRSFFEPEPIPNVCLHC